MRETADSFDGLSGKIKLNSAGDRVGGNYDFWVVGRDNNTQSYEWEREHSFETAKQCLVGFPCLLLEKQGFTVQTGSSGGCGGWHQATISRTLFFPCMIIPYNSKRFSCRLFWQQFLFIDNKKAFKLLTLVFLQNMPSISATHKIHNSRMEKSNV